MLRYICKSKIHRARVTEADIDYDGSITIDRTLMDAADLIPFEEVWVYDITNGNRLQTYVIEGEADSGIIGINGAAARLVYEGDIIIICGYATMEDEEARNFVPRHVLVDRDNRIVKNLISTKTKESKKIRSVN